MENYEYEAGGAHSEMSRYQETFDRFSSLPSDSEVSSIVSSVLDAHFKENFTAETLKFIHGCIDLTTLTSLDTKESVWAMVDKIVNHY